MIFGALVIWLLAVGPATDPGLVGIYEIKVQEADSALSSCLDCGGLGFRSDYICVRLSSGKLMSGCRKSSPVRTDGPLYSLRASARSSVVGCDCCNDGFVATFLLGAVNEGLTGVAVQEHGDFCEGTLVQSCSCVFPVEARRLPLDEMRALEQQFEPDRQFLDQRFPGTSLVSPLSP